MSRLYTTITSLAILMMILIGIPGIGQTCSICGYIEDLDTGEKLLGAHVSFNGTSGAISDDFGFYSHRTTLNDTIRIVVTYVGYQPYLTKLLVNQDTVMNFSLVPRLDLGPITIIGIDKSESEKTNIIGLTKLNPRFIEGLPTLSGTPDILKSSQLLPGIQGGTEGSSSIIIRGGNVDQNLILLDDVPVYYVNHLGGFLSIFDAQAINSMKIYKGGFPAKYGGRLSGIVDIRLKEGRKSETKNTVHMGLLSSEYKREGPLRKDTSSYILSIRRCNVDLFTRIFTLLDSDGDLMAEYTFYDITGKFSRKISWKDKIFFSMYSGRDKLFANGFMASDESNMKYLSSLKTTWGNCISSFRWNHIYNPDLHSNLTLAYSQFFNQNAILASVKNRISNEKLSEQRLNYASKIQDIIIKYDFKSHSVPNNNLSFGINNTLHFFKPYQYKRFDYSTDSEVGFTQRQTSPEIRIYLEDKVRVNDNFNLNTGIHGSYFNATGKSYWSLEPRFSCEWEIDSNSSFQMAYSRMTQNVHMVSSSGIGLAKDLWIPSTKLIAPGKSDQVGISYHWNPDKKLPIHFSIEAYYKKLHNLADYREGAVLFQSDFDWDTSILTGGEGTSKGIEFLFAKDIGRISGWFSYTLSKHDRVFEELNNSQPYPFRYDRRHDASMALLISLSKGIALSMTWVYWTGDAVSLASAEYLVPLMEGNALSYGVAHRYTKKNGYRMPDYHKLDIGLNFSRSFSRFDRKISIGVINAYNRKNPYFLFWAEDSEGKDRLMQMCMFPLMPNISISYSFNKDK